MKKKNNVINKTVYGSNKTERDVDPQLNTILWQVMAHVQYTKRYFISIIKKRGGVIKTFKNTYFPDAQN